MDRPVGGLRSERVDGRARAPQPDHTRERDERAEEHVEIVERRLERARKERAPAQEIAFHTSCSKPLSVGDVFGSIVITTSPNAASSFDELPS